MDINSENIIKNYNQSDDKNALVKNISLEITNTINGLSGFLVLLENRLIDAVEREFLHQAKVSAFTLLKQVENLFEVVSETNSCSNSINLYPLVVNLLNFLNKCENNKNIKIDFEYDETIPETLIGNSLKLGEIIKNLLENALLFANSSVYFAVGQIEKSDKICRIRFDLSYDYVNFGDTDIYKDLESYVYKNVSVKKNITKSDLNLLLSFEILKQYGSQLKCMRELDCIKFYFEIEFKY